VLLVDRFERADFREVAAARRNKDDFHISQSGRLGSADRRDLLPGGDAFVEFD
jgi:hypothetical protein